ncbi:MAG: hypothetical protein A3E01_09170 [Gammaproteobacteria bacterium RIFCSPHIGHO2_12_FULL_63_22]|nr:MAG: hypothetical protein A3E01_09170 [Gammaproteobacteria bacterium RIFCSPHIGHO2_12_FULL_63_22]
MIRLREWTAWAFGWIARSVRFALDMNARRIRALTVWAIVLGIAVEGVCVIFLLLAARRLDRNLVEMVILYSEWLRLGMVGGVIVIAVQANSFKARLGEFVDISANVRDRGESVSPPEEE